MSQTSFDSYFQSYFQQVWNFGKRAYGQWSLADFSFHILKNLLARSTKFSLLVQSCCTDNATHTTEAYIQSLESLNDYMYNKANCKCTAHYDPHKQCNERWSCLFLKTTWGGSAQWKIKFCSSFAIQTVLNAMQMFHCAKKGRIGGGGKS